MTSDIRVLSPQVGLGVKIYDILDYYYFFAFIFPVGSSAPGWSKRSNCRTFLDYYFFAFIFPVGSSAPGWSKRSNCRTFLDYYFFAFISFMESFVVYYLSLFISL